MVGMGNFSITGIILDIASASYLPSICNFVNLSLFFIIILLNFNRKLLLILRIYKIKILLKSNVFFAANHIKSRKCKDF